MKKSNGSGGQTHVSAEKNAKFFLEEYQTYKEQVGSIDSYAFMSFALNGRLAGIQRLLDIGNGGVFDYDTALVEEIVGLDLFLDKLPKDNKIPQNVTMVQGDALNIPKHLSGFNGVVMVMLIHHLVGRTVEDCFANLQKLLSESYRVLQPGGKLLIMESCVPEWFFVLEKILFKPAVFVIERTIAHPPAFQYTADFLCEAMIQAGFISVEKELIPKGKFILQFGLKVPSWITLVQSVLFSAIRP